MSQLIELQKKIGYKFKDEKILIQSVTHRSYAHENLGHLPFTQRDNERLEFFGDAVISFVVANILYKLYPEKNEGQLTKLRSLIVQEKTLAEVARSLGLAHCLRLGKGAAKNNDKDCDSILSSAFEALVSAIHQDSGIAMVQTILESLLKPYLNLDQHEMNQSRFYDFKTKLQELTQEKWKVTPIYKLVGITGPGHEQQFYVEVLVNGSTLGSATGSSKKEAEQNAARVAIR
jgi:ribonuclease-3